MQRNDFLGGKVRDATFRGSPVNLIKEVGTALVLSVSFFLGYVPWSFGRGRLQVAWTCVGSSGRILVFVFA